MLKKIKRTICREFWEQGGNQTELAKKAGIDRKTIYNYIYTSKGVSLEVLVKMCDALDLELTVRKKGKEDV